MIARIGSRTRQRRLLILTVLVSLLAAGCLRGSDPEAAGPNQLVWAIGGAPDVYVLLATEWNKDHPEAQVQVEPLPSAADQQRVQLTLALNAQSPMFDILGLDIIWMGEYATNGWVEDLSDMLPELRRKQVPAAVTAAVWDGKLWGVPMNTNGAFLYYRKDLLDKPPETWEEAKEVAMAAAEKEGIAPFCGQGFQYEGLVVNYLEYFWGAGGEVYADPTGGSEFLFDKGDAAEQALEFMRESNTDGFYAPGFNTMLEEECRVEFTSGNVVMMRNWPYAYGIAIDPAASELTPNQVGIAPLPGFADSPVDSVTALGGFNLGVSAFSEKKEQAREFVRWVGTSPAAQGILVENALAPTLKSEYEKNSDDPVYRMLGEQVLPSAKLRPPSPTYSDLSLTIQENVWPAYNAELGVDAAVTGITTDIAAMTERLNELREIEQEGQQAQGSEQP
ncbi:hypothetical protein BH20ACT9_BH20ACT9_05280 [soil metagenome]